MLLGIINVAIPFFLISWGEQSIDSAVAAILDATVPLFAIVIAHLSLHDDKITLPKVAGLLLGFLGVVVLMSKDLGAPAGSLLGQAAVVVASVFYAGGSVYARLHTQSTHGILRSVGPLLSSTVVMWVAAPVAEAPFRVPHLPITWIALLWLGHLRLRLCLHSFLLSDPCHRPDQDHDGDVSLSAGRRAAGRWLPRRTIDLAVDCGGRADRGQPGRRQSASQIGRDARSNDCGYGRGGQVPVRASWPSSDGPMLASPPSSMLYWARRSRPCRRAPKRHANANSVSSPAPNLQLVFVDTPGVHQARHRLGEYMNQEAEASLEGVDTVLFLADLTSEPTEDDARIAELLRQPPPESADRAGRKQSRSCSNRVLPELGSKPTGLWCPTPPINSDLCCRRPGARSVGGAAWPRSARFGLRNTTRNRSRISMSGKSPQI